MTITELLALRNRFEAIRRNTRVADVEMGEALTDAVDGLDDLTNLRRLHELRMLDEANAAHDEFVAYWIERFSLAGSATVHHEERVA